MMLEGDAGARLRSVRRWALALCGPSDQLPSSLAVSQLPLPPLRPVKAYVPAACSLGDGLGPSASANGGAGSEGGAEAGAGSWELMSSRTLLEDSCQGSIEDFGFQPPPVSQLGAEIRFRDAELALEAPVELVRAAEEAKARCQLGDDLRRAAKHRVLQAAVLQKLEPEIPVMRRRPRVLLKSRTVVRPEGRPPVRGADPMAGSLFSRDVQLDPVALRKGLYEAQLQRVPSPFSAKSACGGAASAIEAGRQHHIYNGR